MLDRIRTRVPPALLGAFALMVVVMPVQAVYQRHLTGLDAPPRDAWAQLALASNATWFATNLLLALGLAELARRLTGPARTLATIAATIVGLLVARTIASIYFQHVSMGSAGTMLAFARWSRRASSLGWLVAAIAVAIAVARRGRPGVIAGAALVAATLGTFPFEAVAQVIDADDPGGKGWFNLGTQLACIVGFAVALGATAYLLSPPEPEVGAATPPPQIAPLERVGTALVARVVLALGVAVFTVMAIGAKSVGVLKLVIVVGPLGLAVTGLALASGLFALGRIAPGPRLRFVGAGALATWVLVATSIQTVAAYRLAFGNPNSSHRESPEMSQAVVAALPNLIPLVGLAALLLLLSGIARLRRDRGLDDAAAAQAGAWLVGGTVAALMLQRYGLTKASGTGEFLLMTVIVATANIAAILAAARMCHKTAWALAADDGPGLATARVVDGNQM